MLSDFSALASVPKEIALLPPLLVTAALVPIAILFSPTTLALVPIAMESFGLPLLLTVAP